MRLMLIGSRALHFWFSDYPLNPKADWDIITDEPEKLRAFLKDFNGRLEIHSDKEFLSDCFWVFGESAEIPEEIFQAFHRRFQENFGDVGDSISRDFVDNLVEFSVCSPRGLSCLKRSHLALDWNWLKHITCWHVWLKDFWCEHDRRLMLAREKVTLEHAKQRAPKLSKGNKEFFQDAVKKVYEHDWLHELVAYGERPLYTRLKHPEKAHLAFCEESLWNTFTHQEKLQCIAEEATVISIERFMVPSDWGYNSKLAWHQSIQKVCTTLTSGWFRSYAIEHHRELSRMYRKDIYTKTKEVLDGSERRTV